VGGWQRWLRVRGQGERACAHAELTCTPAAEPHCHCLPVPGLGSCSSLKCGCCWPSSLRGSPAVGFGRGRAAERRRSLSGWWLAALARTRVPSACLTPTCEQQDALRGLLLLARRSCHVHGKDLNFHVSFTVPLQPGLFVEQSWSADVYAWGVARLSSSFNKRNSKRRVCCAGHQRAQPKPPAA
jgi:hypothetical protein